MFKKNIIICLLTALVLPLCFSCRKNLITTSPSAKLTFQEDTVKFDTVFTTQGSATHSLIIYNTNNEKINISNTRLGGGTGSLFRMNVDGTPTYSINNVQIAAHDSLHIFVAVTVNPNITSNPFLVTDSILFNTNGNDQKVILDAYGQNAHFYNDSVICNQHWINDKPYVIINSVLVDSNCSLTIDPGVRIYMHYGSYLEVKGKLTVGIANSTTDTNTVVFQGDRLEDEYSGIPGQWGGIVIFRKSTGTTLTHTVINEASYGIITGNFQADTNLLDYSSANEPNVSLYQCTIENCLYDGIYSLFSNINATNTLIYSCGQDNVFLYLGGNYTFNSCTFANFSSATISHTSPIVYFANYGKQSNSVYLNPITANFNNTIVYGDISNGNEIAPDSAATGFTYLFQSCLVTTNKPTPSLHYNSILLNENPLFVNSSNNNYHLLFGSPCIGKGYSASEPQYDLDYYLRTGNPPDIGCYEFH